MDLSTGIHGNSVVNDELEQSRKARAMAARAHGIRKRLSSGKPITDSQREWLERYEREHPSKRPVRSAPPLPQPPTLPGVDIEIEGVTNEQSIPNDSAEHRNTYQPDLSESNTKADTKGSDSGNNGKQTDEETRKAAIGLAATYGQWVKLVGKQCSEMGGYAIPDNLVDGIIVPATQRVLEKYLPSLGTPVADEAIVAVTGAGMVVQRTMLRRRHAASNNVVDIPETPNPSKPQDAPVKAPQKQPNQPPVPIRALVQRPNPLDVEIG